MLWTRNQFSCSGCLSCPSGLLFACLNVVAPCLGCNIHCQCMLGTAGMSGFTEGGTCSVQIGDDGTIRLFVTVDGEGYTAVVTPKPGVTLTEADTDEARVCVVQCVCFACSV